MGAKRLGGNGFFGGGKRLGFGGETTRIVNRGKMTRGETSCYHQNQHYRTLIWDINIESTIILVLNIRINEYASGRMIKNFKLLSCGTQIYFFMYNKKPSDQNPLDFHSALEMHAYIQA